MKVGYDATFQKMIGCSHVDLQKAGRREAINNLGSVTWSCIRPGQEHNSIDSWAAPY